MSSPIEWIGASVEDAQHHIRLSLYTDDRTGSMKLELVRWNMGTKQKEIAKFVDGEAEWVGVKDGDYYPDGCGVAFDVFMQPLMLELFSKVLDKSGKPTKNEHHMEGELIAKDAHLQDLRHLLKLPKI
jgi:hypothetical protein